MQQRAHRQEKARADAAAQVQMLAAQQMDRQSSQRNRHNASGPATLQQVGIYCINAMFADNCSQNSCGPRLIAEALLSRH